MADRSKDIHVLAAPIGWRLNNLSGALGRFAYLRCWLDSRCRAGSGRFGSRVAAVAACCLAAPAARRPLFGHRKNLPIARSRMDPDSSGGLREFDSRRSARPTFLVQQRPKGGVSFRQSAPRIRIRRERGPPPTRASAKHPGTPPRLLSGAAEAQCCRRARVAACALQRLRRGYAVS